VFDIRINVGCSHTGRPPLHGTALSTIRPEIAAESVLRFGDNATAHDQQERHETELFHQQFLLLLSRTELRSFLYQKKIARGLASIGAIVLKGSGYG